MWKFRFYDTKREQYAPFGDFYIPPEGGWGTSKCSKYGGYKKDDILVEAFTGMQDRNKRDIYQGDTVTFMGAGWSRGFTTVIWDWAGAMFTSFVGEPLEDLSDVEIIGTTHDKGGNL